MAVQVHEWGGVFTDIVTYSHFRQFRPGLRIAINSHGGHYWSTQVTFPSLMTLPSICTFACACLHASCKYPYEPLMRSLQASQLLHEEV